MAWKNEEKNIEFDINDFWQALSMSRDIKIKNLSSLILPKHKWFLHHENVFKDI